MSTWDYGSEDSPEHRFHRPIRPMDFRNVAPDPQEEPEFTGCRNCGEEDCPGGSPLGVCRLLRPIPLERGFEPDDAEDRIADDRARWSA